MKQGQLKPTGDPFGNEWVQKYVVQDELITEMEECNVQVDTTPQASHAHLQRRYATLWGFTVVDEGPRRTKEGSMSDRGVEDVDLLTS